MKNEAQRAQEQNRAQARPTGTACLIGKVRLLGHVVKRFSACSCSPWGVKTSQMGITNPALPKYEMSHPQFPPQRAQQRVHHPATISGIVYTYLLVPPTPAQQPRPITHPALSSGTLGISTNSPAHPKDPITNPNQPRHNGKVLFFGWWGIPGVDL